MNSHVKYSWHFYQLSFPEIDEIYSKQFYPHKDFSFWPNTERLLKKINSSLCMKEYSFEFDIVCGKTNGFNFWKNIFINGILGVCLTWLDCITICFLIIFGSDLWRKLNLISQMKQFFLKTGWNVLCTWLENNSHEQ